MALVIGTVFLLGTLGVAVSALWAFAVPPRSLPPVTGLETIQPIQGSTLYDENDELITEFQVERRLFVPLAKIPKALKDAILAVEDSRFYSHLGLDPIGIARAFYQNFRRRR
ncbi:MAG: transglycosylase domain-containing protein, partial [Candidatus Methylomirabilia bacterium]